MAVIRHHFALNVLSLLSFALMAAALIALVSTHALFSPAPPAIAVQVAALILMLWARVTFRLRSFHASAEPTAGGLVVAGPYRYIRHPIYTAGCVIGWAGVLSHLSIVSVSLGILLFVGALGRMLSEERLLVQHYPEYRDYATHTKRMLPGVF
jgi:protein-S-isoprenylcysteine O-methyltransferase Ste14